jgi:hypothetical protein
MSIMVSGEDKFVPLFVSYSADNEILITESFKMALPTDKRAVILQKKNSLLIITQVDETSHQSTHFGVVLRE